ncbi:MAG: hypothetical protein JSV66_05780 [Trueperaceae bacterium]|nr:MAG: hypothetical protein JSV66_05780 [Trueperaceae bacterium]
MSLPLSTQVFTVAMWPVSLKLGALCRRSCLRAIEIPVASCLPPSPLGSTGEPWKEYFAVAEPVLERVVVRVLADSSRALPVVPGESFGWFDTAGLLVLAFIYLMSLNSGERCRA